MSKLQLSRLFLFCIAVVMGAHAQSTFFTTLVSFDGPNDANPHAGLVEGNGNFYGTTAAGGNSNWGTVFKITRAGTLITLYSFCSQPNCADGGDPSADLRQGTDGNFYGTTTGGGSDGRDSGTVFRLTPSGSLTTLYSFCAQDGCADGGLPLAGLVQGDDGNFYGTTSAWGVYGNKLRLAPSPALAFTRAKHQALSTAGACAHSMSQSGRPSSTRACRTTVAARQRRF